jgi:Na+/H+-dicarboxylate symporter
MSLNTRIFIGAFFGVILGLWLRQYAPDGSLA